MEHIASEYLSAVPARGLFVARHLVRALGCSLALGMCGGMLGSTLVPNRVGPLLPYLVFSTCGFVLGTTAFWHAETNASIAAARMYPRIMQHHLGTDFPGFDHLRLSAMDLERPTVGTINWLVLARTQAAGDIDAIVRRRADEIIEAHFEGTDGNEQ